MTDKLFQKKCVPCEGGVEPMTRRDFAVYLDQVANWEIHDDKTMDREFEFKSFAEALDWVNKVGVVAEEEGHHPDIFIYSWNKVKISLWTHAINGLSINDFILATRIDRI